MKRVSEQRKADNVLRAEMMEKKYGPRENWRCLFADYSRNAEFTLAGMLTHAGPVNGHEIIKASQWRKGRLEPSNVITLCNFHNGWVEDHPVEAHAMGLMRHVWER